jgi:hypothetical protein
MRKLPVQIEKVCEAFVSSRVDTTFYLDLKSGEVIVLRESMDASDDEEFVTEVESHPDRYVQIPGENTEETYQDMGAFAESTEEGELKTLLEQALDAENPLHEFRDVLPRDPEVKERWTQFRGERVRERVLAWIQELGVEPG